MKQDLRTKLGEKLMGLFMKFTASTSLLMTLVLSFYSHAGSYYSSGDFNYLSSGCRNITAMNDSYSWGDDSNERKPGAISCLKDKEDKDILDKMYKVMRSGYKIRNRSAALTETVGLINLTQAWPGVKCKDGKAGLECRYTDHRGRTRTEKFPALTADYANLYLDKNVTTPLEEKYNVNHPNSMTPEERIAELEKQVKDLSNSNNMCGCSNNGSSYASTGYNQSSTTAAVYSGNGRSPASTSSSPKSSIVDNSSTYNRGNKKASYYNVKGSK